MIDLRYVKKLVEMLDESTVDSIEISTEKGMKIRISKTPQQRGGVSVAAPMAMQLPVAAAPAAPPAVATPSAESVAARTTRRPARAAAPCTEAVTPVMKHASRTAEAMTSRRRATTPSGIALHGRRPDEPFPWAGDGTARRGYALRSGRVVETM